MQFLMKLIVDIESVRASILNKFTILNLDSVLVELFNVKIERQSFYYETQEY